jgi:regulator of replication initiation timing
VAKMTNLDIFVKAIINKETLQQMYEEGFNISAKEYNDLKKKADMALKLFLESQGGF